PKSAIESGEMRSKTEPSATNITLPSTNQARPSKRALSMLDLSRNRRRSKGLCSSNMRANKSAALPGLGVIPVGKFLPPGAKSRGTADAQLVQKKARRGRQNAQSIRNAA